MVCIIGAEEVSFTPALLIEVYMSKRTRSDVQVWFYYIAQEASTNLEEVEICLLLHVKKKKKSEGRKKLFRSDILLRQEQYKIINTYQTHIRKT